MAYTEKGVYYQTDYNEDADILEDMKKMAESIDEVVENSEASADEQYVKKVAGKGLSTNDYDNTEKGKVASNTEARHTHSNKSVLDGTTASYTTEKDSKLTGIATGAQVNVIESVKVNGTAQTVTDKAVNITVPTKASDLTDDSGHYTKPSGGIPKTDLASDVQTSLEKADSALQEHQDITGKEDKSNKVTELTSESTNTQYPGAKAVYDELVSVKAENTKLENKVATLRKTLSQNPQVTDTDYEPTLADTIEAPFEQFEVKGHSEQETTEGKQLLKYPYNETTHTTNGITFTDNGDGTITANGTATADTYFNMWTWVNKYQLEAGTYILSGGTTPNGTNITGGITDTSGNTISGVSNFVISSNTANAVRTINQDFKIYFYITIANGTTLNNYTFRPMFNVGSTALPWEKYTGGQPSPNPSYEQPVKSCGENVQLFDGVMEQGDIPSATGQNQNANNCIRSKNYILIAPSTAYIFIREGIITDSVGIRFYDEEKNYLSTENIAVGHSVRTKTFTSPSNAYYMRFTDWTNDLTNKYMLAKGNKSIPYSPYGMGSVNEKIQSKNLYIISGKTSMGITGSQEDSGYLKVSGIATSSYADVTYEKSISLPAGRYVFSITSVQSSLSVGLKVTFADNTTQDMIVYKNASSPSVTATLSKAIKALRVYIAGFTSGTVIDSSFGVMFSKTGGEWVPHEEQNISIPVQAPFRSIGDVEDEFVLKNDGKWYERHYSPLIDLADLEWEYLNTNTDTGLSTYKSDLTDRKPGNNFKTPRCTHFQYVGTRNADINAYTAGEGIIFYYNDGLPTRTKIYINTTISTLSALITWLEENNVKLQYELAEPTDILCTQLQSDILDSLTETVHTYREGTYISSPDEVKARIKVSGLYDLNKLLTRVETLESEV